MTTELKSLAYYVGMGRTNLTFMCLDTVTRETLRIMVLSVMLSAMKSTRL